MENIEQIEVFNPTTGQNEAHIIIDRGNGEFTSMTKEHWDKLEAQREQSGTL